MRLSTSLLFLLLSSAIWGQNAIYTGTVRDLQNGVPLERASVAFFQSTDSSLLCGTVSDLEGRFILECKVTASAYLEISYVGYRSLYILQPDSLKNRNYSSIPLEPQALLMSGPVISAEQGVLVTEIDRLVYNVGSDVFSQTNTAIDVLQNIPSLVVDMNGSITLRNSGSITYFMDGRPSALMRRNPVAVLEAMPASSIERIEVITNPSAKYQPDGVGGIINIVRKKDTKLGFSGQAGISIGNENRQGGNLILNYGGDEFKISAQYSIRHRKPSRLFVEDKLLFDSNNGDTTFHFIENSETSYDALSHSASLVSSIDVNDHNSVEFSASYFSQGTQHQGISDIAEFEGMYLPLLYMAETNTNDESEMEWDAGISLEHVFGDNEDHNLVIDITRAAFDESEDLTFIENQWFPGSQVEERNILIEKSGQQWESAVEYVLPMGEVSEFEAGYNGEYILENIDYQLEESGNSFQLDLKTHSLYALFGSEIGDLGYKIGVRGETTNYTAHLLAPEDSLSSNRYSRIYPTLHLTYEPTDGQVISLSYSKRISRPDADELNPHAEFTDPRNAEAGNPKLLPQQTHSLELGYRRTIKSLTFLSTAYYRYTWDAFTSIRRPIGDSIVVTTIENLNKRQSGGLELLLTANSGSRLKYHISGDIYFTSLDASNLGFTNRNTGLSGNLKGQIQYKFLKNTRVQLNSFYYFPSITPQGKRNAVWYSNMGLVQHILKQRASITLSYTDLFRTYKVTREYQDPDLYLQSYYRRKQPVVYLGFVWRFRTNVNGNDLNFEPATF